MLLQNDNDCLDSECLSFSPALQSMVAFLKDPTGPPLWEENPDAEHVVHVETEKVSTEITCCLTARCFCMGMCVSWHNVDFLSVYNNRS